MAKDSSYKRGTRFTFEIGGVPDLPYINQPQHAEVHQYTTPPMPDMEDILFSDLKPRDQYWRRIQYPPVFFKYVPNVSDHTDAETRLLEELRDADKDRRLNGLWFMNNGVPNYITGNHYFHLQWGDMINGKAVNGFAYPDYREFQRDWYYFYDLVENTSSCLGEFTAKAKKVGITQMMASAYVNEATLFERCRYGVMSKTGDECESTNMAMMTHIVNKMPLIIKPKLGNQSGMEIEFSHPPTKPTGTKQYQKKIKRQSEERVLESVIKGVKTKVGAFDGPKYKKLWFDEFPKYHQSVKISPKKLFEKDSEAVKVQQEIEGKVHITAYTPEVDDIGFLEAREIYYNSKKLTIKQNSVLKRTKSNLFCYHISSLYATEGTFDVYGKADVEKAYQINQEEREALIDDHSAYQAKVRQYSRHEDESWLIGGGGSVWDNTRLQISLNEKEKKEFMGIPNYRQGNLEWTGPKYRSYVKFVDDPDGRWFMTRMLDPFLLNQFKITDDEKNAFLPSDTVSFVGGVDPFGYMDINPEENEGSQGVSYTLALPNIAMDDYYSNIQVGDSFSKRIIGWYAARPSDANDYFEDMVKDTLYFSKRIIIENNKEWLVKLFKDKGLTRFLLFRNSETKEIEKYKASEIKRHKEISTQTNTVEEICRVIGEYLTKPEKGGVDLCMAIESTELLKQLMKFTPQKTKKFDHVMAFGYSIIALNSFNVLKKVKSDIPGLDMARVISALSG